MEHMRRYSALEIQISAGARTNEATRLLVHIAGAHQIVLLKVSKKYFMNTFPLGGVNRLLSKHIGP